jgi:hypothetical protein
MYEWHSHNCWDFRLTQIFQILARAESWFRCVVSIAAPSPFSKIDAFVIAVGKLHDKHQSID